MRVNSKCQNKVSFFFCYFHDSYIVFDIIKVIIFCVLAKCMGKIISNI